MANEPVRLTFPRIYELLMSKAKKILRLTHLEDRAFFDKILPRLSEEQKKDLNITNLNGFLNHEVDPKSAEIGLRDLDSPKGYGNFYYGKCKIAYILQSLSIIAESTSRYLSYVNYGTRNSLNKMIDILTNNNIGMNNQKIGAFGTSKAQTEFKAFFSTIKSFVSWFKTGYNFDERNGDKHSAAFLECFHKQYYDSRWVQINPQNGLLLQWEDGMYFKEGIKPERSNIFSAWEYLTMESTIMINSKQYTGRTYEIFGHAEMPSEVFKAFVQIYTKTRKPIEQIFPTNSFEWREFLINMDLIPSAKALRPLMLKNLKIMRYYVNSWMDNYSLQHPQKNSPKNPDFTYTTHSGYYVLHRFVHNLAQLSENDIPLFTHIRRYTEPHSSNLNFLYGTEVALYQMFLDFISLIYGLDMAKGRIVIQKLIDKIRYFAQNPDSAFKRTATSYIPPYPDSLIEPNKQVSIFSVHKNRLDNIAVTQPIPNLIIDGLSIFSEFKRTNASEFIIKSSNEIKGIEFNKKIFLFVGIDSQI